jgi:hypothetical protein
VIGKNEVTGQEGHEFVTSMAALCQTRMTDVIRIKSNSFKRLHRTKEMGGFSPPIRLCRNLEQNAHDQVI